MQKIENISFDMYEFVEWEQLGEQEKGRTNDIRRRSKKE